jgi:hypothetical protein
LSHPAHVEGIRVERDTPAFVGLGDLVILPIKRFAAGGAAPTVDQHEISRPRSYSIDK